MNEVINGKGPEVPVHNNCRCYYVPVLKGMEDEYLNGPNYHDWIMGLDPEDQLDILGPSRFALLQEGKDFGQFYNDTGKFMTLKELDAKRLTRKDISFGVMAPIETPWGIVKSTTFQTLNGFLKTGVDITEEQYKIAYASKENWQGKIDRGEIPANQIAGFKSCIKKAEQVMANYKGNLIAVTKPEVPVVKPQPVEKIEIPKWIDQSKLPTGFLLTNERLNQIDYDNLTDQDYASLLNTYNKLIGGKNEGLLSATNEVMKTFIASKLDAFNKSGKALVITQQEDFILNMEKGWTAPVKNPLPEEFVKSLKDKVTAANLKHETDPKAITDLYKNMNVSKIKEIGALIRAEALKEGIPVQSFLKKLEATAAPSNMPSTGKTADYKEFLAHYIPKSLAENVDHATKQYNVSLISPYKRSNALLSTNGVALMKLTTNKPFTSKGAKVPAPNVTRYGHTWIHEFGHIIEMSNTAINIATLKFMEERTKGESSQWLGKGYKKKERAYFDKFLHPYMGAIYNPRKANGIRPTEILSMGLETFFRLSDIIQTDPSLKLDEDYENFIMGVLMSQWGK